MDGEITMKLKRAWLHTGNTLSWISETYTSQKENRDNSKKVDLRFDEFNQNVFEQHNLEQGFDA